MPWACLQSVGYVSWVNAYQSTTPSLVALVAISQIPMTYTWAAIWLHEALDVVKLIGVGCILAALINIMYANFKKKDDEETKESNKMGDASDQASTDGALNSVACKNSAEAKVTPSLEIQGFDSNNSHV